MRLVEKGDFVYSPITHWHFAAVVHHMPFDHSFWQDFDQEMIRRCDLVGVLMLDKWRDSKGVVSEVTFAESIKKPIWFLDPSELGLKES